MRFFTEFTYFSPGVIFRGLEKDANPVKTKYGTGAGNGSYSCKGYGG